MITPEFLKRADNVYRTRFYIVKQEVYVEQDADDNSRIFSNDTFYLRNDKRDREYETVFARRAHIDGKRLPSTAYTRKYVD